MNNPLNSLLFFFGGLPFIQGEIIVNTKNVTTSIAGRRRPKSDTINTEWTMMGAVKLTAPFAE
jgi:hypothetical protein